MNFIKFCESLNRNSNITYVWQKFKKIPGNKRNFNPLIIDDIKRGQLLNNMVIVNIDPN